MNIKKLYILLFILFMGCGSGEVQTISLNCGSMPEGFVQEDIANSPDYIFQIDPEFISITLTDLEGNLAIVNSYEECQHYVKGGWINLLADETDETDETDSKNVFFITLSGLILSLVYYYNFKEFKKYKISIWNLFNYLPVIFFTVSFLSVLVKVLNRGIYFTIYSEQQSIRYISMTLSFIFLFLLGRLINKSLKLESLSLSISYFLLSFFLFESIFLPITKMAKFNIIFMIVGILWIILFRFKKVPFTDIFLVLISYIVLIIFNNKYFKILSDLSEYKIKNTDVEVQWVPLAEMIFNNNLFYSLENNIIPGYGMMLSYTQALIHKINYLNDSFSFVTTDSNLILLMSVFIFFDLKITKFNKVLITASFFIIVLDDGWLRFLLGDSMMLEGLISFLFASFIINISRFSLKQEKGFDKIIYILFFSTLTFSKQFVETLTLLILLIIILTSKNRLYSLTGLALILASNIYNYIYFTGSKTIEYIDRDLNQIILDVIFLRNAEWGNLYLIYEKLIEFKFILSALLLICFFFVLNSLKKSSSDKTRKYVFYAVILNFLLVVILYIFLWQNIETDSSFRYILNTVHLIFISLIIEFETYQKKKLLY